MQYYGKFGRCGQTRYNSVEQVKDSENKQNIKLIIIPKNIYYSQLKIINPVFQYYYFSYKLSQRHIEDFKNRCNHKLKINKINNTFAVSISAHKYLGATKMAKSWIKMLFHV